MRCRCAGPLRIRIAPALAASADLHARAGLALKHSAGIAELDDLRGVLALGKGQIEVEVACEVEGLRGDRLPVHLITFGNPGAASAVGYFGGVHGLERIGSSVLIAWLRSLVSRLDWDSSLHDILESVRVVFMPIVNPGGMVRGTRANSNGVDLMRNAPVEAVEPVPFLIGGQRISAGLPWYRGREGDAMELESTALCSAVQRELTGRAFSLALDCHSGFGMRDRLWFPMAHSREPLEQIGQLHALHEILGSSNPNHQYVMEPQSMQYLAHGDLWDHLVIESQAAQRGNVFVPLTLEMGSWLWVRKNPRQLFSRHGIFNPLIAHREERVLRRHLQLLDFTLRAAASAQRWLPRGDALEMQRAKAVSRWYPNGE